MLIHLLLSGDIFHNLTNNTTVKTRPIADIKLFTLNSGIEKKEGFIRIKTLNNTEIKFTDCQTIINPTKIIRNQVKNVF